MRLKILSLCFYLIFNIIVCALLLCIYHRSKNNYLIFHFSLCQHRPAFNARIKAVKLNHQTFSIRHELSPKKLRRNRKVAPMWATATPIQTQTARNEERYLSHAILVLSIDTFYHIKAQHYSESTLSMAYKELCEKISEKRREIQAGHFVNIQRFKLVIRIFFNFCSL